MNMREIQILPTYLFCIHDVCRAINWPHVDVHICDPHGYNAVLEVHNAHELDSMYCTTKTYKHVMLIMLDDGACFLSCFSAFKSAFTA